MTSPIAQILPYAVTVALSPMPVAAVILLLFSAKAKINSIVFLIGWLISTFLIVILTAIAFHTAVDAVPHNKSELTTILQLILGVVLLVFAVKEWKGRPKPGVMPPMPKWMSTISDFTPMHALGLSILLGVINFKNLPMNIIAGQSIGQLAVSFSSHFIMVFVYVLISCSSIYIPVFLFLIFGSKLNAQFTAMKEWLIYHNNAIMFSLLLIFGVILLSKAFGG